MMWTKKYWQDLLEREIATTAAALVGASVAVDPGSSQWWTFVGVTATVTLIKCLAASQVGSSNTAAMLARGPDTDKG